MNANQRDRLITALLDGDIEPADFSLLEAEIASNDEARRAYFDQINLDALLSSAAESRGPVAVPRPERREFPIKPLAIAASIVALGSASLIGWQAGGGGAKTLPIAEQKVETSVTGYGALAEHADAVWANGLRLDRGDLLPAGELELISGMAQLELFSGVSVIVEGGAKFEVLSRMEMAVQRGKIRALVPEPARGFKIHTASGELVDLGTEFAIDVADDGRADLQVLDGEIEWHPKNGTMRKMAKGDALRWEADGEGSRLPFESNEAGVADLEQSMAEQRRDRREAWLQHSEHLRTDPRLLTYFTMGASHRQVTDHSGNGRHGTVVRTTPAADRWEHRGGALDFSPTGSQVRVDIPGQHRSLTLYCWAKIDGLDRWYNSLFLTDGHETSEPHWQIMDDGRLFFSVKTHDEVKGKSDKQICYSPAFWTPALSGQWLQLATTYEADTHTVTHYLNGEALSSEILSENMRFETIKIGPAAIGNWSQPMYRKDPHFVVRNLNGSIDEFAIFSEVLPADEIKTFYEIGKP